MAVPVLRIVTLLLQAGASVQSVGRVRWLHAEIDEPMPDPVTCALFTLRPDRPDRPDVKIAAANDNQTAEERDAEIQDT